MSRQKGVSPKDCVKGNMNFKLIICILAFLPTLTVALFCALGYMTKLMLQDREDIGYIRGKFESQEIEVVTTVPEEPGIMSKMFTRYINKKRKDGEE